MKVTLLNGHQFSQEELNKKALDDNFYYGYLGQHAFSSSSLKSMLESPKAWYKSLSQKQSDTPALLIGKTIHCKALTPELFDRDFQVVEVQSKNSKAFKEAQSSTDKTCITLDDQRKTDRVVDTLLRNKSFTERLYGSETEIPMIGEIEGYPFRSKADILKGNNIYDLKTTSGISAFPISAQKYNYDLQCYIYCTLFGVNYWDFEFVVVDKSSLDIAVYKCSEEFFNSGRAKLENALELYQSFFEGRTEDEILTNLDNYTFYGTL